MTKSSDDALNIPAVREGPRPTKAVEVRGGRGAVGRIGAKLKSALDLVVWNGKDAFDAAREAGMHPQAMRKALGRAHVVRYLREERQAFRESLKASNMHYAKDIRNNGENDAARVRVLSYIDGDTNADGGGAGTRAVTPGIVIQIVNSPAPYENPQASPIDFDEIITVHDAGGPAIEHK